MADLTLSGSSVIYRFTNIASLSAIPSTFLEHQVGFWAAYLMATISLIISLIVLLCLKNKLGLACLLL
jgi:proton-dependent oligopeptide transporter, POT family